MPSNLKQLVNDYLYGKDYPLMDYNLLGEMADFSKRKDAEHIYYKCLRHGHYSWALAIAKKYGPFQVYDRVMAFGLALVSVNSLKQKKMYERIKYDPTLPLTITEAEFNKLSDAHKAFYKKVDEKPAGQPEAPQGTSSNDAAYEGTYPFDAEAEKTSNVEKAEEKKPEDATEFRGGSGGGGGASADYGTGRDNDADSDRSDNTSNDSTSSNDND